MSLVSKAHFTLVKNRKELEKAFAEGDWEKLRDLDAKLSHALNQVFEDESRDTKLLVEELDSIVKLYSRVVDALPRRAMDLVCASTR